MELFSIQNEELDDLTLNLSNIFDRNSSFHLAEILYGKNNLLFSELKSINTTNDECLYSLVNTCFSENQILNKLLLDYLGKDKEEEMIKVGCRKYDGRLIREQDEGRRKVDLRKKVGEEWMREEEEARMEKRRKIEEAYGERREAEGRKEKENKENKEGRGRIQKDLDGRNENRKSLSSYLFDQKEEDNVKESQNDCLMIQNEMDALKLKLSSISSMHDENFSEPKDLDSNISFGQASEEKNSSFLNKNKIANYYLKPTEKVHEAKHETIVTEKSLDENCEKNKESCPFQKSDFNSNSDDINAPYYQQNQLKEKNSIFKILEGKTQIPYDKLKHNSESYDYREKAIIESSNQGNIDFENDDKLHTSYTSFQYTNERKSSEKTNHEQKIKYDSNNNLEILKIKSKISHNNMNENNASSKKVTEDVNDSIKIGFDHPKNFSQRERKIINSKKIEKQMDCSPNHLSNVKGNEIYLNSSINNEDGICPKNFSNKIDEKINFQESFLEKTIRKMNKELKDMSFEKSTNLSENEAIHSICNKIITDLKRELVEAHKCIADSEKKKEGFYNKKDDNLYKIKK